MYFASPERSFIYRTQEEKNGIVLLQENDDNIINDYPECSFMLIGDLNARTKDVLDFILSDNIVHVLEMLSIIVVLLKHLEQLKMCLEVTVLVEH